MDAKMILISSDLEKVAASSQNSSTNDLQKMVLELQSNVTMKGQTMQNVLNNEDQIRAICEEVVEASNSSSDLRHFYEKMDLLREETDYVRNVVSISAKSKKLNILMFKQTYFVNVFFEVPKTCFEYKSFGLERSDVFRIDPDGAGNGEPPFKVFCNANTGNIIKLSYFNLNAKSLR